MRRYVNFGNVIVEILWKKFVRVRRKTWCVKEEKKKKELWQFSCRNMRGTVKRGTWNFNRNLENFGAHKERELVEGGDKIW